YIGHSTFGITIYPQPISKMEVFSLFYGNGTFLPLFHRFPAKWVRRHISIVPGMVPTWTKILWIGHYCNTHIVVIYFPAIIDPVRGFSPDPVPVPQAFGICDMSVAVLDGYP